jgi:hypothetical protein
MKKFFQNIARKINTFNGEINIEQFDDSNNNSSNSDSSNVNEPTPTATQMPAAGITHKDIANELNRYRAEAELVRNALNLNK